MRGRKPKPRELRALEGNPGKRSLTPASLVPPPEPVEVPDPPAHLNAYALEEWDRISAGLARIGLLTPVDVGALGAYCSAYATWRKAEEGLAAAKDSPPAQGSLFAGDVDNGLTVTVGNGIRIKNPLLSVSEKAQADMVRYAAEFGFTPAARARLGLDVQKLRKGKFSGLIGNKANGG